MRCSVRQQRNRHEGPSRCSSLAIQQQHRLGSRQQPLTDSFEVLRSAEAFASVRGADQKARPGAGSSTCGCVAAGGPGRLMNASNQDWNRMCSHERQQFTGSSQAAGASQASFCSNAQHATR